MLKTKKTKKILYLSVDMLVGQFMETSAHILSKLTCYHPLAAFPKNGYQDDVQKIIKFSYKTITLIVIMVLCHFFKIKKKKKKKKIFC